MFDRESYDMIEKMLANGLISKWEFEIIKRAGNADDAREIILGTINRQMAAVRHYYGDQSNLTRIIADTSRVRKIVGIMKCKDIRKVLADWESLINEIIYPGEKEVSIVFSEKTYYVITEFLDSYGIQQEEDKLIIRPRIKNIFIPEGLSGKIPDQVMHLLHEISEAKIVFGPEEFVEEALNTTVLFGDINPKDEEAVKLLCDLLAQGTFVIVDEAAKPQLDFLITLKKAIDESPVEDGAGVICFDGEVYAEPFNPDTLIGNKAKPLNNGPAACQGGLLENAIRSIFPGGKIVNIG